ncbi:MAG: SOS response-associated peptidase [Pseudomonadota bacterium]
MCGRFALYSDYPRLAAALKLPLAEHPLAPRYNVAPGTWINAVRRADADSQLTLDELWWGYRPHWADDNAPQPINATVEKVATSNYFKGAFAHHRCLVPADGWYEWVRLEGRKQPHFLTRTDREPLWFAGIWTQRPDGKPGCAILTEPARGVAKPIHPRMPLALDAESLEPWLDPDLTDRETIRQVVHHLDADLITHWPVSQRVNKPTEDDADLIEPVNGR